MLPGMAFTHPFPRSALAALSLSAAGLVGIALHEGYSDRAITPVKGDVPTIGFGTTAGVKPGDTTTPPKALARALQDVRKFEGALKQCVRVPLHQHEYDAFVSFAYNVGPGAFCGSTLVKLLNAQDYDGIQLKSIAVPWPSGVWYEPTNPLGTLHFWPVPNGYTIYLRFWQQLQQFDKIGRAHV